MNIKLPSYSNIKIGHHNGFEEITLPIDNGNIMRYLIGAFIIFWLGGWSMGFNSAFTQITSGKGDAFLIFWLGGWSIGGILALAFAYRVLRNPIPEKLLLTKPNLAIDTGIPTYKVNFGYSSPKDQLKTIFPKRHKFEITKEQIKTLTFRETDIGNRLTIDYKNKRIELGTAATEIEREWLFNYILSEYNIETNI